MDTETRAFLEQLAQRLASKADISVLEERLIRRIDDSQEALAGMVKHHVDETLAQFAQLRKRLDVIDEVGDANTWSSSFAASDIESLQTQRTDIDRLASRVKALEAHASERK